MKAARFARKHIRRVIERELTAALSRAPNDPDLLTLTHSAMNKSSGI